MGGTNNLSWRVDTADASYMLRLYQNEGNLTHVTFEHVLLARLSRMGLSFQVPAPVPSHHVRTLQRTRGSGRAAAHASLFPVIPGRHPRPESVEETRASGRALGELDAALAKLSGDPGDPVFPLHAHLERIHPHVPSPTDAIRELEADDELRAGFARMVRGAQDAAPGLYTGLPVQIVHNDIARSNTLVDGERVTGILDFEFSGPDLRVFDLAVGVLMFGADWSAGGFGFELPLVRAFAGGYAAWVQLSPAEIAAVPDVLRLRSAVSVMHRLGRYRAGLASLDDVTSRMREGLRMDAWFREHTDELLNATTPS
jgi:Ser/Thr protein kinase RdoA (MazF antagonist)